MLERFSSPRNLQVFLKMFRGTKPFFYLRNPGVHVKEIDNPIEEEITRPRDEKNQNYSNTNKDLT